MTVEDVAARAVRRNVEKLGPSASVDRFLSGYGNVRTKAAYTERLVAYFSWLKDEMGVTMSPDELIVDNLRCISTSDPTDVLTKRRHTDLMSEYVNKHLIEKGIAESQRGVTTAAIRQFYLTNDSPLFGHFRTASQPVRIPPKPLFAEDVRKVLLAMSPRMRTVPLLVWQSGIEPNRLYRTVFPTDQAPPVRIDLYGRKKHRRPFSTFIGRDSVEHLKQLGTKGLPNLGSAAENFRDAARRLGAKGLLKNPDRESWHIYALRHSFKIEAEHVGAKTPMIEFFLGHAGGARAPGLPAVHIVCDCA